MIRRRLVTATEAAELVGIKPPTFRGWVHRGLIGAITTSPQGLQLYLDLDVYEVERRLRRKKPANRLDPKPI